jgi:hypothetical protein
MQLPHTPVIRLNSDKLPRDWTTLPGSEGISFQSDVAVSPKSSLRLKVLVFRHRADLFRFWKRGLAWGEPHPSTRAVFNPLTVTVEDYSRTPRKLRRPPELLVDPRYFGVIGFIEGALTPEYIIHECIHAGFAYSRRVGGNHHWPDDDEEERVCYPAARLADAVIRSLHNKGMIYAAHL